ncbi:MAG: hypothetical protein HY287_16725 [Planctomycetes bacterium]|nr:hypothetical protein [Planctomycetota bacterium]
MKNRLSVWTLGLVAISSFLPTSDAVAQARHSAPSYIEAGPKTRSRLHTGQVIDLDTETVSKAVCGSDQSKINETFLKENFQKMKALEAAHPYRPPAGNAVAATDPPHFQLVFNVTGSVPADATDALHEIEHYVSGQFSNPITVVINFSFAPLGAGILGQTSSNYTNVTWPTARAGLQNGMDPNDTIQLFLPPNTTIPVRYDGNSATVTNENRVFVTFANYNSTLGTIGGSVATMQFSSNFSWDYTPPSITPGSFCFRSVITHEVGHALGFTSGSDFRNQDIEMLDIYRFQRSDGTGDYNPDDLTEFQNTARMVDINAPGTNDDVNSDLISVEYQMADGSPDQASHFHAQNPGIYIMDPSLSPGETFHPVYFRAGDRDMLDAIGWEYPLINQSCPEAAPMACGAIRYLDNTTIDNPASPLFTCRTSGGQTGTLWYSFVATHTSARISTCDSVATDTILAVYGGSCGSLTEIVCSNNVVGCGASGTQASACVTGLTIGNTYYIQVASNNSGTRGLIALKIQCSCDGACCLQPPATCLQTDEDTCTASLGGTFAGPALACIGDVNGDGVDEVCQTPTISRSQIVTATQEDVASNFDWSDNIPASAVVDDFPGDGRPVQALRWWGSSLDDTAPPDGFIISFHEPLTDGAGSESALGVYFCASNVVTARTLPDPGCDAHPVTEYSAKLFNCCLLQANPDSRTGLTPAQPVQFATDLCVDYELGIQAVVGVTYGTPSCVQTLTAGVATGDFWGWHSTSNDIGDHQALGGPVVVAGGTDWQYGPWSAVSGGCGAHNMSFELITQTATAGLTVFWQNGTPDNSNGMLSQYGGQISDSMTADDITISDPAVINEIHWFADETSTFVWNNNFRLEIYPDNGSNAPDESGGPTFALWVPDDTGTVSRTVLGNGVFANKRVRYDATGLNISLAAGHWWIGLASAGTGINGTTFWLTSHRQGVSLLFFDGESQRRMPSAGVTTFHPWSTYSGGFKYDMAFNLVTTRVTDCNCNGIADDIDVANGGGSLDCNHNGIPDECEPDCNSNGVPDDCDIALGTSTDCQPNGVPDECDIFFGTSTDAHHAGQPDECCFVYGPPTIIPGSDAKNRYLGIAGANPGRSMAIRVRLVSLHHPNPPNLPQYPSPDFTAFEGQDRWVGPPSPRPESDSSPTTFMAAKLQCTPYFTDWSAIGTVHVYGSEIVPSSTYQVQAIDDSCTSGLGSESSYSTSLSLLTARWGDVTAPYQTPSPDGLSQPNVSDIATVVDKFKDSPAAGAKAQVQLQPNSPDPATSVNISDVASTVDAFKQLAYPYPGPQVCP